MKKALLIVFVLLFFASCASYKRCQQKFANTITDSVKVTIPVSILVPRDSVITSFVTDTIPFEREIKQGRARLKIKRTPKLTTVEADCDTVTIYKNVPVRVPGPRVVWGVAPIYKKLTLILSTALGLVLLGCMIAYHKIKTHALENELRKARN